MNNFFALIAGEPESINIEIIAKAWLKIKNSNERKFFVIGSYALIKKQLNKIKIRIPLNNIKNLKEINHKKFLNIYDVKLEFQNPFNISNRYKAKYVLECVKLGHDLSSRKLIKGLINCAIDKKIFNKKFNGLTEYLANLCKITDEVMLIYNKKLSISPLTTHIKLKNVSKNINKKVIIKKIYSLNKNYKKLFKLKPKIAVLSLNPHNSEGRKDCEENKIIIPAIKRLRKLGIDAKGPFPADTIFLKQNNLKYNVIVGMYHDQVLAPFKALYNFDAINITLGLNYLRISPDHGTARELMGLKKAKPDSLTKAIKFMKNYKDDQS